MCLIFAWIVLIVQRRNYLETEVLNITKTRLFKYIENFTTKKLKVFR